MLPGSLYRSCPLTLRLIVVVELEVSISIFVESVLVHGDRDTSHLDRIAKELIQLPII